MTVWEFRACVRAYREWLGCRCPLGVALKVVQGEKGVSFPTAQRACIVLRLPAHYAEGVIEGWADGVVDWNWTTGPDMQLRGERYGRRLCALARRVTP